MWVRSFVVAACAVSGLGASAGEPLPALKEVFRGRFEVGAALADSTLREGDESELALAAGQFASVSPENCLKFGQVHRRPGEL